MAPAGLGAVEYTSAPSCGPRPEGTLTSRVTWTSGCGLHPAAATTTSIAAITTIEPHRRRSIHGTYRPAPSEHPPGSGAATVRDPFVLTGWPAAPIG